ncbi:sporozoite surface protein 2 [Cardiocondyla obscurior]|uniref:sporozoite surface protein 2 n=1 Tax=Cardiocondyla obscurior TaxID=286306 RepID=UPI00396580B5
MTEKRKVDQCPTSREEVQVSFKSKGEISRLGGRLSEVVGPVVEEAIEPGDATPLTGPSRETSVPRAPPPQRVNTPSPPRPPPATSQHHQNPGHQSQNPGHHNPGNSPHNPDNPGHQTHNPGNPGHNPGNPGHNPGNPGHNPGNPGNPGHNPGNPSNPSPAQQDQNPGDQPVQNPGNPTSPGREAPPHPNGNRSI